MAYNPNGTVAENAKSWSDLLDSLTALAGQLSDGVDEVRVRIEALENPPIPAISISGTPPATGQVGAAYNFTPTTANGSGTKAFTLSSGTLLGGLSFNTATGSISGSPTVAGTMSGLVVTVTDSTGSASTTPTSVTIAASVAITIDPIVRKSGQDYTFTARRTGDVSAAVSRTIQVGSSIDYPPGSLAADWPGGSFPTATASFAAGSPTASFTITAPVAAQPE